MELLLPLDVVCHSLTPLLTQIIGADCGSALDQSVTSFYLLVSMIVWGCVDLPVVLMS